MQLDAKDCALFFRLNRSLMFFVGQRLKVISHHVEDPDDYSALPPESRLKVHEALLKNMSLIQTFVDDNPSGLSREELDIVLSWRHLVHGKFFLLRELTNYTVFLSSQAPPIAYGVLALSQPFEALIGPRLPVMVQTILLPFRNQIVYDSTMFTFNIHFGPGIRRSLNEDFKAAKARLGIVTSLPITQVPASKTAAPIRPVPVRKKSDPAAVDQLYPTLANFVRSQGHIEIGDQEGVGFTARALDYGGLVFESAAVNTLAGAMAALEKGSPSVPTKSETK